MRYFYEYKEKNGSIVGGFNLEKINLFDDYIGLSCVHIIPTIYGNEKYYRSITLDIKEIEYLKIVPMLEKEND